MMMVLLQILLLASLLVTIQAKIFGHCELAEELEKNGLDGFDGYSLANWLCMSFYESGFDTDAIELQKDGSKNYGIFHISNIWWCKDEDTNSDNLCNMRCSDLLNDQLDDDINCAKRIVKDPKGMGVWKQWKIHCRNQDLSQWMKGCLI